MRTKQPGDQDRCVYRIGQHTFKISRFRKRFISEYLKDLNPKNAAIRAGYKSNHISELARKLIKNPIVKQIIEHEIEEGLIKARVNRDWVLNKIVQTIERCSQAEPVMIYDPQTKTHVHSGEYQFDSRSVLKGCELLGKHLKLFEETIQQNNVQNNYHLQIVKAMERLQDPKEVTNAKKQENEEN